MILIIKAFIYRLTGIYLAQKEEANYCNSLEAEMYFERLVNSVGIDEESAQTIVIGDWQYRNGFYR
jgi:hypothetical protein